MVIKISYYYHLKKFILCFRPGERTRCSSASLIRITVGDVIRCNNIKLQIFNERLQLVNTKKSSILFIHRNIDYVSGVLQSRSFIGPRLEPTNINAGNFNNVGKISTFNEIEISKDVMGTSMFKNEIEFDNFDSGTGKMIHATRKNKYLSLCFL